MFRSTDTNTDDTAPEHVEDLPMSDTDTFPDGPQLFQAWAGAASLNYTLEEVEHTMTDFIIISSHLEEWGSTFESRRRYFSRHPDMIAPFLELKAQGVTPGHHERLYLRRAVNHYLTSDLTLEKVQDVWSLRHMPFTEPYMKTLLIKLSNVNDSLHDAVNNAGNKWNDQKYCEDALKQVTMLEWVNANTELLGRFKSMAATLLHKFNHKKEPRASFQSQPSDRMWKRALGLQYQYQQT